MKPRILTLAEVDALIPEEDAFPSIMLPSVLRMARVMAMQAERVAYCTHIVGDEWAVSAYTGKDGDARRSVTVGLAEAIEEACNDPR